MLYRYKKCTIGFVSIIFEQIIVVILIVIIKLLYRKMIKTDSEY